MNNFKTFLSNFELHLDPVKRSLTIRYGISVLVLRVTEEGRVKLETDLTLEGMIDRLNRADDPIEKPEPAAAEQSKEA